MQHNNTDFCTFRFDLEQSEIVSNLSRLDNDKLVDIIKELLEKKNSNELSMAVEHAANVDRLERDINNGDYVPPVEQPLLKLLGESLRPRRMKDLLDEEEEPVTMEQYHKQIHG